MFVKLYYNVEEPIFLIREYVNQKTVLLQGQKFRADLFYPGLFKIKVYLQFLIQRKKLKVLLATLEKEKVALPTKHDKGTGKLRHYIFWTKRFMAVDIDFDTGFLTILWLPFSCLQTYHVPSKHVAKTYDARKRVIFCSDTIIACKFGPVTNS